MDKTCPLNMIGNSSGQTLVCAKDRCMFWDEENKTCVMISFFQVSQCDEGYIVPKAGDNKDVA